MILSFPIDSWLLLLVAVGLGLGLEIAFYRARRLDGRGPPHLRSSDAQKPDPRPSDDAGAGHGRGRLT
jgi:hypothetical protein